jgi:predicted transcriptional regulator
MNRVAVKRRRAVRRPRFLVDDRGAKVSVVIDIREYERMLDIEEELEAIRAYDAAKASGEKPVPLKDALRRLGGRR